MSLFEELLQVNEYLAKGDFKIISECVDINTHIICKDKYGELKVKPKFLLYNLPLNLTFAVNKTEYFINKANEVHGIGKYDYSLVEYVNSKDKVKIICNTHGVFEQSPGKHLGGKGCRKCAFKRIASDKKYSRDVYIEKAIKVHGNKYTYDNVEYNSSSDIVEITCPIHGNFKQIAPNHLSGMGCPKCGDIRGAKARTMGKSLFTDKANNIHNYKYDYSLVDDNFIFSSIVSIVCKEHGEFKQTVREHLSGCGCQKCAKESRINYRKSYPNTWTIGGWFSKAKSSLYFDSYKFYILRFYNDEEEFLKSGITFNKIERRYKTKHQTGGYKYEVLRLIERFNKDSFEDCEYIFKLERRYQNLYKKYKHKPISSFSGENECFTLSEAGIKKMK